MVETRLTFEERKFVLKCYWKCENIAEVQREFKKVLGKNPPTRLTVARLRDKFEADGTVLDVHKERSGRPRTSMNPMTEKKVLETYHQSPQKSIRQVACEVGISNSSVRRILKLALPAPEPSEVTNSSDMASIE